MKLDKEFTENKAILIDEKNLKFLNDFLTKHFKRLRYTGRCNDKTQIEFEDINQIIDYENPSFRKLTGIKIYADNRTDLDKFSNIVLYYEFGIELGGNWSFQTIEYKISSDNLEQINHFENELRQRIKELRPWYWLISKVSFGTLLFIVYFGYIILNGFTTFKNRVNGQKPIEDNISLSQSEIVFLLATSVIIFAGIIFLVDKFKNYLFPKVVISLGRQTVVESKRKNVIYLIFGIVILSIIINLVSNLIWESLH